MTLIIANMRSNFVGVSDLMITSKGGGGAVANPISGLISPDAGNSSIVFFEQKSVIIGPSELIMWAGIEKIAMKIINALHIERKAGKIIILNELISDLLEESESKKVHLMYLTIDEKDTVLLQHFNIGSTPDNKVWGAGSGFDDFMGNGDTSIAEAVFPNAFIEYCSKIAIALARADIDGGPHKEEYGGWFEIILKEKGKFVKHLICW